MTQVLRIGFAAAVMALASASALSDSAPAGSLSAERGQAGNAQAAMLDKADVIARSGEGPLSDLGGASRSAPPVVYGGARAANPQLAPADNKRLVKWSYIDSLTEFIGFEGGSR